MGSVAMPTTGLVGMDANVVIYSVEKHPRYSPALRDLWLAVSAGQLQVVVSELALLETLVAPYRNNDQQLATDIEDFLVLPGITLAPISHSILRQAARISLQSLDSLFVSAVRPNDATNRVSKQR